MTWLTAAIVALGVLCASASVEAQDFYNGKTVRIVVGFTAGRADKAKLEIAPVTGEEIERTIANIFKLDAPTIAKLRTILLD